jgi:hypothetical protein
MGLKVTRPYINVCGFESKAIPTHGVVENVEVQLKEFPEKTVHIDIIVVDVPVIARFVGKVKKLESRVETGVTGASPPTVTSMGGSFYLGGLVQGRRP